MALAHISRASSGLICGQSRCFPFKFIQPLTPDGVSTVHRVPLWWSADVEMNSRDSEVNVLDKRHMTSNWEDDAFPLWK